MKAILEIEMPKSCCECKVSFYIWTKDEYRRCIPTGQDVSEYIEYRAPFCPLKIAPCCANANKLEDGKCEGYCKSEIDDEPASMCMYCKQNEFYEE